MGLVLQARQMVSFRGDNLVDQNTLLTVGSPSSARTTGRFAHVALARVAVHHDLR